MFYTVDIESRSECDLKTEGLYKYVAHPSTRIICVCYAFGDRGKVFTWMPGNLRPIKLGDHNGPLVAHNAAFERLMLKHHSPFVFDDEQWVCSAHLARARGLPGSLENAARFADVRQKKDHRGAALIKKCCVPPFAGTYDDIQELIEYCRQDVRATRSLYLSLDPMTDQELRDYHVNERINDRGFKIDRGLATAASRMAEQVTQEAKQKVIAATNGQVTSFRSPKFTQFIHQLLPPAAQTFMELPDRLSLDKNIRATILDWAECYPDEAADCELALELIEAADESSVGSATKFARALAMADDRDDIICGAYMFNGAQTGRASSKQLQVQNLYRRQHKDPQAARDAVVMGLPIVPAYGDTVTDVLRRLLRPLIIPEDGNVLVISDWSAIEARVNPWLSDNAEEKLDFFRRGVDVYKVNASRTFSVPVEQVDKDQRQIGKVQELSLGYGGGKGALSNMARAYGIALAEESKQPLVDAWRKANPWATRYWRDLEQAAKRSLLAPGEAFRAGKMAYRYDHNQRTLIATLPSGRSLYYPQTRLDDDGQLSYAKAAWIPAAGSEADWPRASLWGGLLSENNAQALSNCLLRHALALAERSGLKVTMHSHDEIVVECKANLGEILQDKLTAVMLDLPSWASGLPLAAETHVSARYGK